MEPTVDSPAAQLPSFEAEQLGQRFRQVRRTTEALAAPLSPEDQQLQSMPDASPTKWHLGHTSWFFETFLLQPNLSRYRVFHPRFGYLFNSYYEALGERQARPQRGMLSRPTLEEVMAYRQHVSSWMAELIAHDGHRLAPLLELGLNHEQQHQELLLTDIKHAFSLNALEPEYAAIATGGSARPAAHRFLPFEGGIRRIGHEGGGFAFDLEGPAHDVLLQPFELGSQLITNAEYLAFIEDGGYARPELWLSDGWATVQGQGWTAPLYWKQRDGEWRVFTLGGTRRLNPGEPVCHVSYYEADAFARWAGARLPTELEWETAAKTAPVEGNLLDSRRLHPSVTPGPSTGGGPEQLFGDVWEWTGSAYLPYPGFRPAPGAVGEYNGKFMCNQFVLRGGSCATPASHLRATYRNFFPPHVRWQFSGIRLARDLT
jgi:ergothioneine biosynthesis protein EgtB